MKSTNKCNQSLICTWMSWAMTRTYCLKPWILTAWSNAWWYTRVKVFICLVVASQSRISSNQSMKRSIQTASQYKRCCNFKMLWKLKSICWGLWGSLIEGTQKQSLNLLAQELKTTSTLSPRYICSISNANCFRPAGPTLNAWKTLMSGKNTSPCEWILKMLSNSIREF